MIKAKKQQKKVRKKEQKKESEKEKMKDKGRGQTVKRKRMNKWKKEATARK